MIKTMTRRKEIQWEAGGIVNRMIEQGFSENRDTYDTYYQAFQDGALWADKTMVDKFLYWLTMKSPFIDNKDMDKAIVELRKYLEE